MARVTVRPERFEYVDFDAGHITTVVTDLCDALGLADVDVRLDVAELETIARVKSLRAERPSTIEVDVTGAALEDAHAPRTVSEARARQVLGVVLLRGADRLDPSFGTPPAEADLTLPQLTAWETWAEGRADRAGLPTRRARRLYHFRLRHGFADAIDAVFDRLWHADRLTWSDIDATVAETNGLNPGPLAPTDA